MASQSYSFTIPSYKSPEGLAEAVINFLSESENMETQLMVPDQNGSVCVVQGRVRGGGFKQFFGLDKAITVRFNVLQGGNTVNVEIGEAKWGDKGVAMTVGMFIIAWPLAITSAIGMYKQGQLPNKILGVIQQYLSN